MKFSQSVIAAYALYLSSAAARPVDTYEAGTGGSYDDKTPQTYGDDNNTGSKPYGAGSGASYPDNGKGGKHPWDRNWGERPSWWNDNCSDADYETYRKQYEGRRRGGDRNGPKSTGQSGYGTDTDRDTDAGYGGGKSTGPHKWNKNWGKRPTWWNDNCSVEEYEKYRKQYEGGRGRKPSHGGNGGYGTDSDDARRPKRHWPKKYGPRPKDFDSDCSDGEWNKWVNKYRNKKHSSGRRHRQWPKNYGTKPRDFDSDCTDGEWQKWVKKHGGKKPVYDDETDCETDVAPTPNKPTYGGAAPAPKAPTYGDAAPTPKAPTYGDAAPAPKTPAPVAPKAPECIYEAPKPNQKGYDYKEEHATYGKFPWKKQWGAAPEDYSADCTKDVYEKIAKEKGCKPHTWPEQWGTKPVDYSSDCDDAAWEKICKEKKTRKHSWRSGRWGKRRDDWNSDCSDGEFEKENKKHPRPFPAAECKVDEYGKPLPNPIPYKAAEAPKPAAPAAPKYGDAAPAPKAPTYGDAAPAPKAPTYGDASPAPKAPKAPKKVVYVTDDDCTDDDDFKYPKKHSWRHKSWGKRPADWNSDCDDETYEKERRKHRGRKHRGGDRKHKGGDYSDSDDDSYGHGKKATRPKGGKKHGDYDSDSDDNSYGHGKKTTRPKGGKKHGDYDSDTDSGYKTGGDRKHRGGDRKHRGGKKYGGNTDDDCTDDEADRRRRGGRPGHGKDYGHGNATKPTYGDDASKPTYGDNGSKPTYGDNGSKPTYGDNGAGSSPSYPTYDTSSTGSKPNDYATVTEPTANYS